MDKRTLAVAGCAAVLAVPLSALTACGSSSSGAPTPKTQVSRESGRYDTSNSDFAVIRVNGIKCITWDFYGASGAISCDFAGVSGK